VSFHNGTIKIGARIKKRGKKEREREREKKEKRKKRKEKKEKKEKKRKKRKRRKRRKKEKKEKDWLEQREERSTEPMRKERRGFYSAFLAFFNRRPLKSPTNQQQASQKFLRLNAASLALITYSQRCVLFVGESIETMGLLSHSCDLQKHQHRPRTTHSHPITLSFSWSPSFPLNIPWTGGLKVGNSQRGQKNKEKRGK